MENLKKILIDEGLACIIKQEDNIYKETERGVVPIVKHYEEGHLQNAYIVDKVIGKASAIFMILGGPKAIHGRVISEPALEIIQRNNIQVSYDEVVKNIINRDGTDLCPMEKSVLNEDDLNKGADTILWKIKK
ncbi:MAG: DUF1893 domain-containing protein [Anaerovoracaceae bacterium]